MYFQSVLTQFLVAKAASPVIAPTFLFCEAFYWLGARRRRKQRKASMAPSSTPSESGSK